MRLREYLETNKKLTENSKPLYESAVKLVPGLKLSIRELAYNCDGYFWFCNNNTYNGMSTADLGFFSDVDDEFLNKVCTVLQVYDRVALVDIVDNTCVGDYKTIDEAVQELKF